MSDQLNERQAIALDKIVKGETVFLTGPGGTGKTFLIQIVKKWAEDVGKTIAVTALTGVAASLIGGVTLHSWTELGVKLSTKEEMVKKMERYPELIQKWRLTEILVIDEVSMISAELLNKLNYIAQYFRESTEFFGGLQVVFSGDFCQLPPINVDRMCFESKHWRDNIKPENIVCLTEIIRQTDPVYQKILNEIRQGIITPECKKILDSRLVKHHRDYLDSLGPMDIKPTELYPYNRSVDQINKSEVDRLVKEGKDSEIYNAKDSISTHNTEPVGIQIKKTLSEFLENSCRVASQIKLAVGAQVMLLYNLDVEKGLCNGTIGIVTRFDSGTGCPYVKFYNGLELLVRQREFKVPHDKYVLVRRQVPLALAFAYSLHKSQGQSISMAKMDLSNVFTEGQAYVGLSRVRSLDGLFLTGINYKKIRCNHKVKKFYDDLIGSGKK